MVETLAAQMATDLMLAAARSVSRHQVLNAFAGYEDAPNLRTDVAEQLVDAVLELIETADIEIEVSGA
jgi:hypothetical protein